ncbi:MAG: alpha-galactosidase, partial [Candidatus Latescibacterota bacterium]
RLGLWPVQTFDRIAPPRIPAACQEMSNARQWVFARFSAESSVPPFSFSYDGRSSSEILKTWRVARSEIKRDNNRTERILTYTDTITLLEVRCQVIEYSDFPAVEWVVHFKNNGNNDTPIIENVQALDIFLTRSHQGEFVLHHAKGSNSRMDDFQPADDSLAPGSRHRIHSFGIESWAMSSVESLPFFNVESAGKGIIAAVGWSGAWSAEFIRDMSRGVQIRSGMDTTHLLLHPGETIRTPRMLILFWEGDRIRAHNLWRRLLLEHYTPQPGGTMLRVPLCDASWGEMTADEQIEKINWWKDHDLPMECFWIDAGWNGTKGEDCFTAANNRLPRKDLYPIGMKPVSDSAHQAGMKFLLWTWPHTARADVEIGVEHPEWVLPGNGLDHGNPEVNRWMIDKYCRSVDEHSLDVFRQDGHSIYPLDEAANRVGMNQIRYTEGFYEFWDALLKSHPNLIIDNCAGGGRKIDMETIQRSIPLWRSDYQSGPKGLLDFDPIGIQSQTWALSQWVPLSAAATTVKSVYAFRSSYSPGLVICWHLYEKQIDSKDYDFDLCRKLLNEYLSLRKLFYGDYYPLTPYSLNATDWMAWQFDRPDLGEGIVQAFRRPECADESANYKLGGLDPDTTYVLTHLDEPRIIKKSGRELMAEGVSLTIKDCPGAVIWHYRRVN